MKKISSSILIFLMLLNVISCHHNRLKTNEKELAKEILIQEKTKQETEKTVLEKESSETGTKSRGSFRKKEIRSVDPQKPPARIDIIGKGNNARKLKLSDVASSIRYVKLQTPPDTALLYDPYFSHNDLNSYIRSDGEQIILQGIFGLTRFNMQGAYQETIWKNERGVMAQGKVYLDNFYGVLHSNPVSILNGNIYFSFTDGLSSEQFMKYKPETIINISVPTQPEVPGPDSVKGEILLSTQKRFQDRFNWVYGVGSDMWVGINNKLTAGISGSLLVTYNKLGDTVCQFTDYNRIINFSQPNYRIPEEFVNYYYDGLLTIKQEFNDTVFRLIPPNRLLPVYVIDFGKYKVNYEEGINPKFDLSEKYLLYSFHETNDFLFIRYNQNHYNPNNIKKNSVKFYNVLFNKRQKSLYHQSGFTLLPEGLENDLDGGIPFWPEFITPQGEMMKLVSGRVLKDYINSDNFKKSTFSEEKKQKQISMASGLRPTDMIVVIVK